MAKVKIDETTQELIDLAKDCSKKTGMKLSRIAVQAGHNGNLFTHLEDGGSCTLKTYTAVKQRIAELNAAAE